MIEFAVLGSGSQANSYIFYYKDVAIVIDNGFSVSELKRRVSESNISLSSITSLFLTHMHADHMKGAAAACRALSIPLYHAAEIPSDKLKTKKGPFCIPISINEEIAIGPFTITAFKTYHDSPFSLGYTLHVAGRKFTILTDTGKTDNFMLDSLLSSNVVFLEANYDEDALFSGPYPPFLKKRIASDYGHLSNAEAIKILQEFPENALPDKVFLCHLSEQNNSVKDIDYLVTKHIPWNDRITICERNKCYTSAIQGLQRGVRVHD